MLGAAVAVAAAVAGLYHFCWGCGSSLFAAFKHLSTVSLLEIYGRVCPSPVEESICESGAGLDAATPFVMPFGEEIASGWKFTV